MLLQFSVSNFMSLRDEVILSMSASDKDHEHEDVLFSIGSERILPVAAIYGANAAGKSNIFKALTAAIMIIRQSTSRQIDDRLPWIVPFIFDDSSAYQVTKFDFIFTTKEKKYQYGFSANREKIVDEYLYEYKSAWPSKIFERTNTSDYTFTKANEKEFRGYVEKNTENKLFLATATAWNCNKTKDAYMWFANGINVYDVKNTEFIGLSTISKGSNDLKEYLLDTLRKADFNIDSYSFNVRKISLENLKQSDLSDAFPEILKLADPEMDSRQYEIRTKHNIQTEKGVNKTYELPFIAESEGTQRMFFLAALIKSAMDAGKTMFIDEIDSSLHPILVKFIINMFNDRNSNHGKAQLIFSTHDVSLLSLDLFRRDQIYFVEKSHTSAVTTLYSLDEFSPRKTENVRKGYLQGRYGAIPVIDPGDTLW